MKLASAVAVAIAAAVISAPASAVLICRNDLGQQVSWQWGHPRPALGIGTFDIRPQRSLSCYVNSYALTVGAANTRLPFIALSSPDASGPGLVYVGNDARWLLINLPSASGVPLYQADWAALPY